MAGSDIWEGGLTRAQACVGPGWHGILRALIADLQKLGWDGRLCQVKQKFGSLRFYIETGNAAIWDRIGRAEIESQHICEQCGKPGSIQWAGWWRCLCQECGKESSIRTGQAEEKEDGPAH